MGSYKPKRNTQGEVMTQIVADLAEARTLIPITFTAISRITRNAVIAGQARAAVWSRSWQTVVDRTTEVITAQPLTSRTSFQSLWTTRTLGENQSTEVIWKLNVTAANIGSAIGSLWQDVGAGAVQASASQKLLNQYDQANDVRWNTYFTLVGTRRLISKYGVVIGANAENFQYDTKMIRTSEMVLARAEAYAELNQLANANTDLAALRTARIANYTHTPITDQATLISEIINERYKELAFEGQRYYDLRRRRLPIQRDLSDVAGNASIQTLPPTDSKYLLPVPFAEVFANPNVGQNPGY
jgi:starch-binding outer membrane protein, SusD/RagB family